MAELEPGPELDALVAEKVMEWHRNLGEYQASGWFDKHNQHTGYEDDRSLEYQDPDEYPVWSPSTSIADAWPLLEKLEQPKLARLPDGSWSVLFVCRGVDGVSAPTAPHAICLAVKKTVEQADAQADG